MLRKVLEQLKEYREKYKITPKHINITKRQYKRLKKELSIVENITEDIKLLYCINFRIKEE